jgi:lysophospholipase L1-like esterase
MMCPPPTVDAPVFRAVLGDSVELSKKLPGFYRAFAQECGVAFFDAGSVIKTSPIDGIHLEPEDHLKLAEAVAEIIPGLLEGGR